MYVNIYYALRFVKHFLRNCYKALIVKLDKWMSSLQFPQSEGIFCGVAGAFAAASLANGFRSWFTPIALVITFCLRQCSHSDSWLGIELDFCTHRSGLVFVGWRWLLSGGLTRGDGIRRCGSQN
jgi:hypothetical protein